MKTTKLPVYHYTRVYISESNAMKPEDTDIQREEKKCHQSSHTAVLGAIRFDRIAQ